MLNAGLILAGRSPDVVNALRSGDEAGQQVRNFQRQNDLNALYQDQGADIAAGNQPALNALAAFSPEAALNIQGARQNLAQDAGRYQMAQQAHGMNMQQGALDMQMVRQRMASMSADEQRAIETHAMNLSAAEREQQRADIEADLAVLMTAQTPEQWDQYAQQTGNPNMVGGFGDREGLIAPYIGLQEVLERQGSGSEPAGVQALRIRANEAGLQPGSPEYQQFMASGGVPSQSTSLSVDPETGQVSFTQGTGSAADSAGNGKDLTVDAAKNTGFLIRARDSAQVLDALEAEGTDLGAKIANGIPILGNYLQTPEYRQYDQARRDFINAVLRRESGAVIADSEFANAERQYFPQPGDDPATIAQKRQNRANAIQGFEIGAGDGVNRIAPQQVQQPPTQQESQAPAIDFSQMDTSSILQIDTSNMSLADFAAWNRRMDELGLGQ